MSAPTHRSAAAPDRAFAFGSGRTATWVDALDDARLDDFRNVRDPELRRERGLFVIEGRKNVEALVVHGRFDVKAVLVSPAAFDALAHVWSRLAPGAEIHVAPPALLDAVVGFRIHRGCLAVAHRRDALAIDDVLSPLRAQAAAAPRLVVALEDLTDIDNVGSAFRNALALGASAIVLSPRCCDPLYRKAVRVSMGAVLRLPYARAERWPEGLDPFRDAGFEIVALDPAPDAGDLAALASPGGRGAVGRPAGRVLVLGSEGDGLSDALRCYADARVRIPMAAGVDSLNVATAAAIAMYALGPSASRPAGA